MSRPLLGVSMWLDLGAALWICVAILDEYRSLEGDEPLIERAAEGDHDAFQVLVERHQRWMVRFLESLVSNRADAEELAQAVFLRAFVNLRRFRGDASFRTWLRTIAARQAFDLFRKQRADVDELRDDLPSLQPCDGSALEARDAIMRALERVPYVYREILVLRYIEELELDEISRTLDLGGSATRMRLSRARDYFRQAYSELGLTIPS